MTRDKAELGFKPKPGFDSLISHMPTPTRHPNVLFLGSLAETTDSCYILCF